MEVSGQHHPPAALPPAKEPPVPLDRRRSGPQSRSGHGGEEKNSQPPSGLEPPIIMPVVQRYTELSRLLCGNSKIDLRKYEHFVKILTDGSDSD